MAHALKPFLNVKAVRSFFTTVNPNRGRERYRRASLSASTSFVAQTLNIVISLVSVPLTLRYLGQERYGVWLTISSLLTWVAMTDFGLAGNALVNVIAEANGNDDRVLARQYAASAFWMLIAITLTIGALFLITFAWIPWRAVFRVSTSVSTQELQQACALTIGLFVLALPFSMLNSVCSAYQEGYVANVWKIAGNTVALAALIIATQFRGGLPQLVFALSGSRVVLGFANFYYLFFCRYRWLAPKLSAVRWLRTKRLVTLGSKYMVAQLAGLGIHQSQPIIITQLFGPSQVLIFVVAQKILTLPGSLVYMAITPLLSAYSEAKARGDWTWIKGAFKTSMIASLAFGVTLTAGLAFAAKPLIRMWAGAAAVPDSALVFWLAAYALLAIATLPAGQMLCGLEESVGVQALALTLCAIGTIALAILFAQWWGLIGIAAAMSTSVLFIQGAVYVHEVRRVLLAVPIHAPGAEPCPKTVRV